MHYLFAFHTHLLLHCELVLRLWFLFVLVFLFRLEQLVHQVCNLSARLYEGSLEGLNLVLEVSEVALLEAGRLVAVDEQRHLLMELSFLLKGPSLAFFRL